MFVIFLLSLLGLCDCQVPDAPEQKFILNFESPVYVVGGDDFIDTSRIMCDRYNETTAQMYGEVEFLKDLESIMIEMTLLKEASGKLEVVFTHDICDLCKELADESSDYKGYLQYLGIPTSCPINAGTFGIHNLVVETEQFQLKDTDCGHYMCEIDMYQKTGDNCKQDRDLFCTLKLDLSIESSG